MQEIVDEAHAGGSETEQRLCRELEVYMYSCDRGSGRPQNISDILWEMMQSNDTKSENLDEDFDEILEKARIKVEWKCESLHFWAEKMMTTVRDRIKEDLRSNPPMESVVTLAAEWFSHGEMIQLQGVFCALVRQFEGMAAQGHRG